MSLHGILTGLIAFAVIGVFHPLVIKGEYYLGEKPCRILFLLLGAAAITASLFVGSRVASGALGIIGCTAFWSIHEVSQQVRRVEKGWFPNNPSRTPKQMQKEF